MKISVFGLGYVGAVSLACLARDGHEVIGVDKDPNKLSMIRAGKAPIVEEGIQELMAAVVESGRVTVTDNAAEAVSNSDISFVCVGTPSSDNGSQDLTAIKKVSEQIGEGLRSHTGRHVVVVRSTVEPGTISEIVGPALEQRSGKKLSEGFGLCFQPEFLREGTSIKDYDSPPFTVVGTDSQETAQVLRQLFGHLPCEFFATEISTAEMLKYACNSFHAVKIAFANEIGRISKSLGADSHSVMDLLCKDTRLNISPAYLKPGFSFGGSCLPKDLRAVNYLAKQNDVDLPMMRSVLPSNRVHTDAATKLVLDKGNRKVGLLGLSFKAGTDDLRESPLVTLVEQLIGKGFELKVYDPLVNVSQLIGANRAFIENSIPHISALMTDNIEDVISHADTLIFGSADSEVLQAALPLVRSNQYVVDLVNLPKGALDCDVEGVCW